MTVRHSRTSPSGRYKELLAQYRLMHVRGEPERNRTADQTYIGASLLPNVRAIKIVIDRFRARTILDYGSGKGHPYHAERVRLPDGSLIPSILAFWSVESVTCYDPAYEPFSQLPHKKFDGVISTDVLEHCPEEDLPWILDEIFAFASMFVYLNVASYRARKHLPNGENAHCTVRPPQWWKDVVAGVAARHPHVRYFVSTRSFQTLPDGRRKALAELVNG